MRYKRTLQVLQDILQGFRSKRKKHEKQSSIGHIGTSSIFAPDLDGRPSLSQALCVLACNITKRIIQFDADSLSDAKPSELADYPSFAGSDVINHISRIGVDKTNNPTDRPITSGPINK